MLCPYCLHNETKVVDKRDIEGLSKRRRECLKCNKRFGTREIVDRPEIRVLKKDGRREEFDIDKIKKGIIRACEKRPISTERIEKMVMNIEQRARKKGNELKSNFIGDLVSAELKKVDKVAYVRFASVYKDFTELDDFKNEIRGLIGK